MDTAISVAMNAALHNVTHNLPNCVPCNAPHLWALASLLSISFLGYFWLRILLSLRQQKKYYFLLYLEVYYLKILYISPAKPSINASLTPLRQVLPVLIKVHIKFGSLHSCHYTFAVSAVVCFCFLRLNLQRLAAEVSHVWKKLWGWKIFSVSDWIYLISQHSLGHAGL